MRQKINLFFCLLVILSVGLGCEQLSKPTRKNTPDFEISVRQLEKELDENEAATRKKYGGKTLAIKGKVEMKTELSLILVSPENVRFPVQCFFKESERESFKQIQRGKEYMLIGVFNDGVKNSGNFISDCKPV